MDAGGADCTSVPCGSAASMGPGCDGFLGAAAVCSRCTLRAGLSFLSGALLGSPFGIFSVGIVGIAFGDFSGSASRPPWNLAVSSHREMASFRSSIAAHPERAKLADTAIAMSARRALAFDNPRDCRRLPY